MSRLDLVVGPNGAGKSTFIELTLAPLLPGSVLVNADVIAARLWPDDPAQHAYEAARVAADTRNVLIEQRRPFIAETVFSHPSKLDLISAAMTQSYTIALHVVLVPEQVAVDRVTRRVAAGGHFVPEDTIRQRYERLWPLVVQAAERVTMATFYDSTTRPNPTIVAELYGGAVSGRTIWPSWTPPPLREHWPSHTAT